MLKEAGATHCIIGHSEAAAKLRENDEAVNRKVRAALAAGLTPSFGVGEMLPDREGGKTFDVVGRQVAGGLKEIPPPGRPASSWRTSPSGDRTGKTATPAQAQEVHASCGDGCGKQWGGAADSVRSSTRLREAGQHRRADGERGHRRALVGGASLSPSRSRRS